MAAIDTENTPKETFLEADKEIPGQRFACLSFISPQKVLASKDIFFFSEFLQDYELQYKIRATETFLMSQVAKLQTSLSKLQDAVEEQKTKSSWEKSDWEKVSADVTSLRGALTANATSDLEKHVKAEMADFKVSTIQETYDTFLFKHKKRIEDDFYAKNSFRTTVQGLKVRGVYDTYNEAVARAKSLQRTDPSFNVYVGQVGFWLPWDPEPHEVADQEYADDQLNTLMKKYKENEAVRDEFFQKEKHEKQKGAVLKSAPKIGASGSATGAAEETTDGAGNMFAGEDLAIARKKEQETIQHA